MAGFENVDYNFAMFSYFAFLPGFRVLVKGLLVRERAL